MWACDELSGHRCGYVHFCLSLILIKLMQLPLICSVSMVHDMDIINMHLALRCWGCDRHEKGVSSYLTPTYISKAIAVCAVGEFGLCIPFY
jgi:hypothetical protein